MQNTEKKNKSGIPSHIAKKQDAQYSNLTPHRFTIIAENVGQEQKKRQILLNQ